MPSDWASARAARRVGLRHGHYRLADEGRLVKLLLLAPPGAGKGTQGTKLAERYGIAHLASGDMLRAEVTAGSPIGREAKAVMDSGELVPDELVVDLMLSGILASPEGWILDGFPRTLPQAEAAYVWAKERGQTFDAVLSLRVPEDELLERLLGRAQTAGRTDDEEPTIRHRLEVFHAQTEPLEAYYEGRGVLVPVDAVGPVDEVFDRIVGALDAKVRP
jgi:adenylate kinase